MNKECISIIVPCYNEEETVSIFIRETEKTAARMRKKYNLTFEYIFVNDGSKDKTLAVIKEEAKELPYIRYISFSRNFGKEAAMYAGLKAAKGDYVAVMDVDLQDPPHLLEEMYTALKDEQYDCCATRRTTRKGEPKIRSFFARMFYKLMQKISKADVVDGARDYRLMKRKMVDAILSLGEYNRFSKGIFGWVGFETKWLEYENVERSAGVTKWSFWKLFAYSLDGIVAFSNVPLSVASVLGLLFCAVSFLMIIVFVVKTLVFGDPVAGYPSLVCIIFFVTGVQLFCLGIVGQYLSKMYLETKKRPIYIEKESNIEKEQSVKLEA